MESQLPELCRGGVIDALIDHTAGLILLHEDRSIDDPIANVPSRFCTGWWQPVQMTIPAALYLSRGGWGEIGVGTLVQQGTALFAVPPRSPFGG